MEKMFSLMLLLVLLMSGCNKEEVGKDVPVTPSEPSPPSTETPSFKDNHYAVLYNDNGWDESTFFANGSQFHIKKDNETGKVKNLFGWLVDKNKQIHSVVAEINEDGMPSKISYGNMDIYVPRYDEIALDMAVFVNDALIFYNNNVVHELSFAPISRNWKDNNYVRNTIAILTLALGTTEIIIGGFEVGVSVISGNIGAAGLGALAVAGGIADIKESHDLLFSSPEAVNEDWNSVIRDLSDNSVDIGKALKDENSNLYKMLKERKALKELDLKVTDAKGLASLMLSLLDKFFGKSYNSIDQILEFIQNVSVITNMPEKVTETSAQISAFYSYTDNDGVKDINMEYGMRYYKTEQPNANHNLWNAYWNDGFEYKFLLEGLVENTEYSYVAFYHELVHDWYFMGNEITFSTQSQKDGIIVAYDNIRLTQQGDLYYINVDVTAKCEAVNKQSSITDWGVYCVTGDEKRLKFSIGNQYIQNTVTCSYPINIDNYSKNITSDSILVEDMKTFGVYINRGGLITYWDKDDKIFTVGKKWPTVDKAVDLGLSVKWASYNVGSGSPADYGGLYGWGDPTGTLTYQPWSSDYPNYIEDDDTCLSFYGGNNPPSNICGSALDIATAKWGAPWRLPSYSESKELFDECNCMDASYMGVEGLLVIGKNLNSIFLPYSGYYDMEGTTPLERGSRVLCWTGTLVPDSHRHAYTTDNAGTGHYGTRCDGHSVRPVRP